MRHGDCLEVMPTLEAASVDAVVCDPPYGLSFMGKDWDHGIPGVAFWREALRVAKPGAALLAFGGTRTYHRLACAIEDADWEIRDTLSWLYGSGFPKSKALLKPAWEPITLARKPGPLLPLAIDACRIGTTDKVHTPGPNGGMGGVAWRGMEGRDDRLPSQYEQSPAGRWPANVLLDPESAALLDAQSGERKSAPQGRGGNWNDNAVKVGPTGLAKHGLSANYGDTGGASRFYYVAKASRREREAGLEGMPRQTVQSGCGGDMPVDDQGKSRDRFKVTAANVHPTVKPLALMRWLCRLVTPPGGLILDPFAGSGSTGCASVLEGFRFLGIEQEAEYVAIAERRIAHWASTVQPDLEPAA